MTRRLTNQAIQTFGKAANKACLAATTKDPVHLARAVNNVAVGLANLCAALPLFDCLQAFQIIGRVLPRQALPLGG